MPSEERMTVDERRKYLRVVAPRYAEAGRSGRSALLTEIAAVTGLHRKSLLRLLHGPTLDRAPKRPRVGRKRYRTAVADVVRVVWESLDYVCAERLIRLRRTANGAAVGPVGRAGPDGRGGRAAGGDQQGHGPAALAAIPVG